MNTPSPVLQVRYATAADNSSLTAFRIAQFKTSREFEVLDFSHFNECRGKVYLVESGEVLVSTVQMEKIDSLQDLVRYAHVQIPEDFSRLATLYLSKGATVKAFRKTGLNSLIRRLVLEEVIADPTVQSLTGVGYEHSPRLNLLKDIGYVLTEISLLDETYTRPIGKVFLLTLTRDKFQAAYERLLATIEAIPYQLILPEAFSLV
jgi:hypothetical protein